jgi:hypothetical protein
MYNFVAWSCIYIYIYIHIYVCVCVCVCVCDVVTSTKGISPFSLKTSILTRSPQKLTPFTFRKGWCTGMKGEANMCTRRSW